MNLKLIFPNISPETSPLGLVKHIFWPSPKTMLIIPSLEPAALLALTYTLASTVAKTL